MKLEDLIRLHYMEFQELAVAPDDRDILAVFGNLDMPHDEYARDERNRSIWRISLDDGDYSKLTEPEEDARLPAWSPDGERIAYVSRASGTNEIWIMNRDGSDRRQLTSSDFPARNPYPASNVALKWSPDGTKLAYCALPKGSPYSVMMKSRLFDVVQKTGEVVAIDNSWLAGHKHMTDLQQESRLCIYDFAAGESKVVASSSDALYRLLGWTSDGRALVAGLKDELLAIDPVAGTQDVLCSGQVTLVAFQGQTMLVLTRTDAGMQLERVVDGVCESSTPLQVPNGFSPQVLIPSGNALMGTLREGTSNLLLSVDTRTSEIRRLTQEGCCATEFGRPIASLNREVSVVFPCSSSSEPEELWKCSLDGVPERVSSIHSGLDRSTLGKVRTVRYENEGWSIESLMVLPPDYQSDQTYPALIYLHGGPESSNMARFTELYSARAQSVAYWLASHGYVILMPNFRGSGGYGEAFMHELSDYRLLTTPYSDVMAAADYLAAEGIADADRIGIYGSSFGGWLTAWTITQTDRFRCAAPALGYYDSLTLDRLNGTPFWAFRPNRRGHADPMDLWRNPEHYKKLSPIDHIHNVKTPTLIIETSAERDMGFWKGYPMANGLCALGVETAYVLYPHAYHSAGWNDDYKRDYARRLLAWFDHYLKDIPLPDWFYRKEEY